MKTATLFASFASLVAGLALLAACHSGHEHAGHSHDSKTAGPLCPVSGDALGSMGDPYVFMHEGHQVKLCCESCKKDFLKDPQKYLSKMAK